jgi:limonene-1,2-epoxide hydrolase
MSTEETSVTRRKMFLAGGAGALAVAAFASSASAAHHEMGAAEKANVKVVDDLVQNFNDPNKMAMSFADDAAIRMFEDKPAVIGPKAFVEEVKKISNPNDKFEVEVHEVFARGPLVANVRTDTQKTPGKPDQAFKVVGVFIVKGGKIKEWTDYLDV